MDRVHMSLQRKMQHVILEYEWQMAKHVVLMTPYGSYIVDGRKVNCER